MEEDHDFRFVCKLCNKKYPCGKSLGGHMRSHVVANSGESSLEKNDPTMKKSSPISGYVEFVNGQTSYGLRENPRKSWRAVGSNFSLPQERICKTCGKGFQNLKALCGHMACHSERDKGLKDDQYSWTSENQKLVLDSHSDTDDADDRILRSSKSKRCKKIVQSSFTLANSSNNNNNNGSSSVSEIDGDENEEVARCLMMLSRDSGNKGGVNSVVESSDNNSVILATKSSSIDMRIGRREAVKLVDNQEDEMKKVGEIAEVQNSDSGYFLDECAKYESDASVDGYRRNNGSFFDYDNKPLMNMRSGSYRAEVKKELKRENEYNNGGSSSRIESRKRRYNSITDKSELCDEYDRNIKTNNESQKRSKYECFNCKKTFKSYQALGGHRPCHKRSNAFYEPRYESGENSLEESAEFVANANNNNRKSSADKKMKAKKNKGHVCPFCDRVFKNGQALGGHKRSHFIGGHVVNNIRSSIVKADLLDLNLPAPVDDDDDDGAEQYSPC